MKIRAHPWLYFLLVSLAATAAATDLKIVRVQPGWRDAESFQRISEYFDGRENTGGQLVLRTHADSRAGCYFFVRIANPGAPITSRITLAVITPAAATPQTFAFTAELKSGDTVLHLGLTGSDWPDKKAAPVAWKLEFLSADGQPLATEKSFLWEKPAQ